MRKYQDTTIELTEEELNNVSGGNDLINAFVQGFNKGSTEPSPAPKQTTSGRGGGWIEVYS
jgi:bacteriocin-like protein